MSYVKLFSSILTSSIWMRDDQTRLVWITMLALADKHGEVQASVPGLARLAGVSLEACEKAIEILESPDKYSRTTDNEGRRIVKIDGGWAIINHLKYREMATDADRKTKSSERQQRSRALRGEFVTPCHASVTPNGVSVTQNEVSVTPSDVKNEETSILSRQISQAEADTDTDNTREGVVPPPQAKKASKARERNDLLDAIVASTGGDPEQTTATAWSAAAKALSDIKQVSPNLNRDELHARARRYRALHPTWDLTPMALAKHWGAIAPDYPASRPAGAPQAQQTTWAGKTDLEILREAQG